MEGQKTDRFDQKQLLSLSAAACFTPLLRLIPALPVEYAGRGAWLAPFFSLPLVLAYALLLGRCLSLRREGEGLAELIERRLGRVPLFLTGLALLFYEGFLLRAGAERLVTTVYPEGRELSFLLTLGLLALTAALGPARSLARVGRLMLPLLSAILLLPLLTALFSLRVENLLPVKETSGLFFAGLSGFEALLPGIFCYAFLFCHTGEGKVRARPALSFLFFLLLLELLLALAVLGQFGAELSAMLTRPFFYLVRNLVFFGSLERVEALVASLWVFPDFLLSASFLHAAQRCLRRSLGYPIEKTLPRFGDLNGGRWLLLLSGLASLGLACLLGHDHESYQLLSEHIVPTAWALFALLLPAAILLRKRS